MCGALLSFDVTKYRNGEFKLVGLIACRVADVTVFWPEDKNNIRKYSLIVSVIWNMKQRDLDRGYKTHTHTVCKMLGIGFWWVF